MKPKEHSEQITKREHRLLADTASQEKLIMESVSKEHQQSSGHL